MVSRAVEGWGNVGTVLNRSFLDPPTPPRRDRLFSPQHPPEIGAVDPQQLRELASTPHQAQKLSQLLKPSCVYRCHRLGFLAQLLTRPNQLEQRFVRDLPCVYRKLNPDVVVMKSAEDRSRFDGSNPLNHARNRRVFI